MKPNCAVAAPKSSGMRGAINGNTPGITSAAWHREATHIKCRATTTWKASRSKDMTGKQLHPNKAPNLTVEKPTKQPNSTHMPKLARKSCTADFTMHALVPPATLSHCRLSEPAKSSMHPSNCQAATPYGKHASMSNTNRRNF
eukprot:gnl/MRDRNA2_/MRDRNA2_84310_c0_seq1.p1 gnl/MRDRNA2_/MRDRNA2_84310_c0~~gnl/MRDRNA2_/MRDRNA2_84310_c0_seq1.p1  ORF type:complete len:143 (-),score=21.88 gnl/MRDRNA2_/MRDRNA2_84310_c0_seq1:327-755(-)